VWKGIAAQDMPRKSVMVRVKKERSVHETRTFNNFVYFMMQSHYGSIYKTMTNKGINDS
jgi:hypothetical protein